MFAGYSDLKIVYIKKTNQINIQSPSNDVSFFGATVTTIDPGSSQSSTTAQSISQPSYTTTSSKQSTSSYAHPTSSTQSTSRPSYTITSSKQSTSSNSPYQTTTNVVKNFTNYKNSNSNLTFTQIMIISCGTIAALVIIYIIIHYKSKIKNFTNIKYNH